MLGQVTRDREEGLCCHDCGKLFVEAHGYPVFCMACYFEACQVVSSTGEDKPKYEQATKDEF